MSEEFEMGWRMARWNAEDTEMFEELYSKICSNLNAEMILTYELDF